ncbi:MAG: UDP-N-acetylmuramate dehydrogenase [Armatimonadota bacterium]
MIEVGPLITSSHIEENGSTVSILDELEREISASTRGNVRRNEPMSRHTTFCVGGPADLYLEPQAEEDLVLMLRLLYQAGIPVRIIGNGSNILVSDHGVRGAIIRLTPNFAQISREDNTIIAGAGAKLARVVFFAAEEELSGLESTMGIPGTIGGGLVMNAGTDIGSISDLVEVATFLTASGERIEKTGDQLSYGYRHSALQGGNLIVLSARLKLTPGEKDAIRAKMARLEEKRTSRQPTRCRTAGSTFKNLPDIAAGKLIDRAGCKGHQIGGAEVSTKHANFIIAHPEATASDIRNLANWMHRRVREVHDRELEMEVEIIGDWGGWSPDEEA